MDFTQLTSYTELDRNGARQAIIDNTLTSSLGFGFKADGSLEDLEKLFSDWNYTNISVKDLYENAVDKVGFFVDCFKWFTYNN